MKTRKNYKVDEVVRQLSQKGCVITLDKPITKTINDVEYPSKEEVQQKYDDFLKQQNSVEMMKDLVLMGSELTTEKWKNIFIQRNQKFLSPKQIRREIAVQAPYVVNISEAFELGNKSWGKIDFLVNYNGFTVSREKI